MLLVKLNSHTTAAGRLEFENAFELCHTLTVCNYWWVRWICLLNLLAYTSVSMTFSYWDALVSFVCCTTLDKKKNHHRDSRREERCSTCDIMLDQARSAQGKSDPRLSETFALRWSRLIEHDITRGTAFFSPRISRMVLFLSRVVYYSKARVVCSHWDGREQPLHKMTKQTLLLPFLCRTTSFKPKRLSFEWLLIILRQFQPPALSLVHFFFLPVYILQGWPDS